MLALQGKYARGLAVLVVALVGLAALIYRPPATAQGGHTYYVSRTGNNGDGLSWGTAWNELSRINWSVIRPGDTILIDGGATACPSLGPGYNCGMVYNSTLSVGASGTSTAPITIRLAGETGRNGTVIIDGGLTQWSRCSEYASEPTPPSSPNGAGTRETGVTMGNSQWITIDGTKWGGIEIRNHTRYGFNFSAGQNILARYLKVHHNTDPVDTTNHAVGVTQSYLAQNVTLARSEVFRNGQDAIRGGGDYFTLEENYLHDHYCNHPDGIQAFVPTNNGDVPDNAGEIRGLIIRRNIWERIGLQTIFLGENATHNSWNVDVTIHDNLFLDNAYAIKSKHGSSTNWVIYNNTFYQGDQFGVEWCCASPGARAPMAINNNIFVQIKEGTTAFWLPTGNGSTQFNNNCLYRTGSRGGNVSEAGTVNADPRFIDPAGGNFALASGSPCAGKGSAITSVSQLLSLTAGTVGSGGTSPSPTPQPTNTQTPSQATNTPAPEATNTPTPQPTNTPVTQPTSTPVSQPTATTAPTSATLRFGPVADAYVDSDKRSTNFGTSTIVRTYGSPEQRTYLRFTVQGVSGRPVTRAYLRIYANGSSPVGFQVKGVNDTSWSETNITYGNAPNPAGVINSIGEHGGARYVTVDVTKYIGGDGTYTIALVTKSTKAVSYPSREASSNRPELVVEVGTTSASAVNVGPMAFLPIVGSSH